MNHEAIQELIPAYAIGATDVEERAAVEAHVADCVRCKALLMEYQLLADDLVYTVPRVQAPARLEERLRRRIKQSAPREEQWRGWLGRLKESGLGWAAAMAVVVLLVVSNAYWMAQVKEIEERAAVQATAVVVLAEAPTVRLQGDAVAPEARGALYYRPESRIAVLHVYELPRLPEGKVYQLWLIRDGERESGGLFEVDEEGEGTLLVVAPRPMKEYEAIGVTVEPAGGSPGPTSPRVIGGKL